MKIDHIALYVYDLESARIFFEKFFGAKANDMYHNPKTGLQTYILSFDEGSRLEIMTRPNITTRSKSEFDEGFIHLSFAVGSKENVDMFTSLLKDNGYEVLSGPRTTGDGYYESCICGPENILIEITE